MRILTIILLFICSASLGQKFTNYYDFRDGTGATLTDAVGSANGTIAGTATAPAWANTNKYLKFTGGNGATAGDRGRVDFTRTTFQYTYNSAYTSIIIFRTTKSDANNHCLFAVYDGSSATNYTLFYVDASEYLFKSDICGAGQAKTMQGSIAFNDGKWHVIIWIKTGSNSASSYIDGKPYALTTNQNQTSGNLYSTNAKATLGAFWNNGTSSYKVDLTGDVCRFTNSGVALTVADVQNIQNEFEILL